MTRWAAMIALAMPMAAPLAAQSGNADYGWSYSYPAQARAIPALKAWFDADARTRRAALAKEAADDRREAARDGRPFLRHQASRVWKVVADTPRVLSLSLDADGYSGGAHGLSSFDSLLWDKTARARLKPVALFTDAAALGAAIRQPFCAELDRQRAKKRGAPVPANSGDEFDRCIDPVAETLILGSSDRRTFDRIGVLVAPYDAGPFAEGSYEVTLPVTPGVLATVRPEWRRYFSVGAGSRGTP